MAQSAPHGQLVSKHAAASPPNASAGPESNQLKLYRKWLEKYAGAINESAPKTVGEIKSLVDKDDLTIQFLLQGFLPEPYEFDRDYAMVLEKLFHYLQEEVQFVKADVDINCSLKPKEVLECKVSDDEDLAILLCSIASALGDEAAHVVVCELENMTTHAVVVTEFQEQFMLLDACQKKPFNSFSGNKSDVLSRYAFEGSKIRRFLYRFNSRDYEQFL